MKYQDLVLLHPNLRSFWRLDDASGDAIDLGPGVHNGTVGSATDRLQTAIMHSSQSSASMGFGTFNKNVVPGDVYDFAGATAFSVVAWVSPSSNPAFGSIVCKRGVSGGTGSTDGWELRTFTGGRLQALRQVSNTVTSASTAVSPAMAASGAYMVAMTYDAAAIRAYIFGAGTLVATASVSDTRSLIDTAGAFSVGLQSDTTLNSYPGRIGNVAVFDAAVPQAVLMRLHLVGYRARRPARIAF